MTRRTWKNIAVPIAVPVVAGLVLAGILRLGGLLGKVVLWVWSVLSWIWELLYSSHPVPGWVILVLGLLALFGLIIIVLMLKEFLHGKSESPEPTFLTYTEDMVDGGFAPKVHVESKILGLNQKCCLNHKSGG